MYYWYISMVVPLKCRNAPANNLPELWRQPALITSHTVCMPRWFTPSAPNGSIGRHLPMAGNRSYRGTTTTIVGKYRGKGQQQEGAPVVVDVAPEAGNGRRSYLVGDGPHIYHRFVLYSIDIYQ